MKFEMTEKKSSVEITWSLMHPTPLDEDYMARVIREADASPVPVDSFEICAMCHSVLGGLDGLCHFPAFDFSEGDDIRFFLYNTTGLNIVPRIGIFFAF